MKERQSHSLKSDIMVGIGGLSIALGAAIYSVRDDLPFTRPEGKRAVIGTCYIDKIKVVAHCSPGTPRVCEEWAQDVLKSGDENLRFPKGCEQVGAVVTGKWD